MRGVIRESEERHGAGLSLVPRVKRKESAVGPDLQIAPNIWIEEIAVTSRSGPDAVPQHASSPVPVARDVCRMSR